MSGYKYSTAELDRQREQQLRLLSSMNETRRVLDWLAARIREHLEKMPEGLKASFAGEVEDAASWLRAEEEQRREAYDMRTETSTLRSATSSASALLKRGHEIRNTLALDLARRSDAMAKALVSKLSGLEGTYYAHNELLVIWAEQGSSSEYQTLFDKAKHLLEKKHLSELSRQLEDIETALGSRIREAQDLEHRHQKRLYVLKALRQVCREMGFEEVEPQYERGGKRNRIVYEVDTLDQGSIKFFLSLDGIATDSGIAEDRCLDEFDKISRHLQDEFGVKTRFRREEERPDGRLMQRGELDLPDGTQMERTA